MNIYADIELRDFDAWDGAVHTLDVLIDKGDDAVVEQLLMEFFECDYVTATEVNDMLRFEQDTIASWLGYESWEQYENNTDED